MTDTDQIDKNTLEIAQVDDEVYTDMTALGDELPGHSPRYILLSYPMTLVRPCIFEDFSRLWISPAATVY